MRRLAAQSLTMLTHASLQAELRGSCGLRLLPHSCRRSQPRSLSPTPPSPSRRCRRTLSPDRSSSPAPASHDAASASPLDVRDAQKAHETEVKGAHTPLTRIDAKRSTPSPDRCGIATIQCPDTATRSSRATRDALATGLHREREERRRDTGLALDNCARPLAPDALSLPSPAARKSRSVSSSPVLHCLIGR